MIYIIMPYLRRIWPCVTWKSHLDFDDLIEFDRAKSRVARCDVMHSELPTLHATQDIAIDLVVSARVSWLWPANSMPGPCGPTDIGVELMVGPVEASYYPWLHSCMAF